LNDTQGLNTGGSDNKVDQGRTDLEFGEEQMGGGDGRSIEFR